MGNCWTCAEHEIYELKNDTTAELFSFEGHECHAYVNKVYDGDTYHLKIKYDGRFIIVKCRAIGYDSPEMKPPKTQVDRDAEIKAAKAARQALVDKIGTDCIVYAKFGKFDKYGRPLVTIFKDKLNLNEWMIKAGYGIPYQGGTKTKFNEQKMYKISEE